MSERTVRFESQGSQPRPSASKQRPRPQPEPAVTRSLHVYFKEQPGNNTKHWQLTIEDLDARGKITYCMAYDIVILGSGWVSRSTPQHPGSSPRYAGKLSICEISSSRKTLEEAKDIIYGVNSKVDPKATKYDCQDYVLDILNHFVQKSIIDLDDLCFRDAMKELLKQYRK